VKKFFLFAIATIICISTGNPFGDGSKENVAYASNELDNSLTSVTKENTEKSNAEFAYEMAQITEKIFAPTTVESFKYAFTYATAQITAKVMPMLPSDQRTAFAYKMANLTTKIISDQNLNIERAKTDFSYEIAQITTRIIMNGNRIATNQTITPKVSNTVNEQQTSLFRNNANIEPKATGTANNTGNDQKTSLLRNNASIEPKATGTANNTGNDQKISLLRNNANIEPKATGTANNNGNDQRTSLLRNNTGNEQKPSLLRNNADIELKATRTASNTGTDRKAANTGDVAPETYTSLMDELKQVGDRGNHPDNKVNISGEISYHYAFNRGSEPWNRDSSGINTRLDFDANINKDWTANATLERQKTVGNNKYEFESRLSVTGKTGTTRVTAGTFSYLMAEGNIYDAGFKGVRIDFAGPVKYTLSYGETDNTKQTYIATASYNDFNYNLEAGIYHYQLAGMVENTLWTLGGNYNFSNFSVGAMYLGSSLKDSKGSCNGYVLSLNYGAMKTYRPGTYDIFAKYYNQPVGTYIEHGMNGLADLMQGFRGFGIGTHYTYTKNLVASIEVYNLREKVSGKKGNTVWSALTYYF